MKNGPYSEGLNIKDAELLFGANVRPQVEQPADDLGDFFHEAIVQSATPEDERTQRTLFPSGRVDILNPIEEAGLSINPGFATMDGDLHDAAWDAVEEAKKIQSPGAALLAYQACQKIIPEFSTQFTEQEMRSLVAGASDGIRQMSYALSRLDSALMTEIHLAGYNACFTQFFNESLLSCISDARIAHRMREAMQTWQALPSTPERNHFLTYPMHYAEDAILVKKIVDMGKTLARMMQFQVASGASPESNLVLAGWGNSSRTLFIFDHDDPHCIVTSMMHELVHVCQSNDLLRSEGLPAWEQSTEAWRKFEKPKIYNITKEAEAHWIDCNVVAAMLKESGLDLNSYCKAQAITQAYKGGIEILIDLFEKHRHNVSREEMVPASFEAEWIERAKAQGGNAVREIQPGKFISV